MKYSREDIHNMTPFEIDVLMGMWADQKEKEKNDNK